MSQPMKGITCCGDCVYYDWKKRKCKQCKSIETDARKHFYDDCPLPEVVEVVRCKDCKYCEAFDDEETAEPLIFDDLIWCNLHEFGRKPDYYCGDAERKDGDGE